jgi:hypothetical protein
MIFSNNRQVNHLFLTNIKEVDSFVLGKEDKKNYDSRERERDRKQENRKR